MSNMVLRDARLALCCIASASKNTKRLTSEVENRSDQTLYCNEALAHHNMTCVGLIGSGYVPKGIMVDMDSPVCLVHLLWEI